MEYKVEKNSNYKFNVVKTVYELENWIREWFDKNGKNANAIIGMSGGKDSTIAAKLLCNALGSERVIGVAMPDVEQNQGDNDAFEICKEFKMKYFSVNISPACNKIYEEINDSGQTPSIQSRQNIPPRIRMTVLYTLGQTLNARVVNTCNLSEDYIGYSTKFGDAAGDFSLFAHLTVTEILAIGDYLGIKHEWVHKTPDDGLPFSCPDEKKFGFTYAQLDNYLRTGEEIEGCLANDSNELIMDKINRMHNANIHKMVEMPAYIPYIENIYKLD